MKPGSRSQRSGHWWNRRSAAVDPAWRAELREAAQLRHRRCRRPVTQITYATAALKDSCRPAMQALSSAQRSSARTQGQQQRCDDSTNDHCVRAAAWFHA